MKFEIYKRKTDLEFFYLNLMSCSSITTSIGAKDGVELRASPTVTRYFALKNTILNFR